MGSSTKDANEIQNREASSPKTEPLILPFQEVVITEPLLDTSTDPASDDEGIEAIERFVILDSDRDDTHSSILSGVYSEAGVRITGPHPATFHRRLIVTGKKYLGLAPAHVQPGDVVVILVGALVPIVLRRVDNHHILVGEAYVHGIMDGEAMPQDENIRAAAFSEEFEIW